ncbi:MAG: hypothetical protein IT370_02850 [Deltaproteobacteria bacterium]|nr:hypothetical protein [Deltaproteobacteria bacterium]
MRLLLLGLTLALGLAGTAGCTAALGLQGGPALRKPGGEVSLRTALGTGKADGMGLTWSTELGYVEGPFQEGGAFQMRSGLEGQSVLTSSGLVLRAGPHFGVRAAGEGEALYTVVGLGGGIAPVIKHWVLPASQQTNHLTVGGYFSIDYLVNGSRWDTASMRNQDVPSQLVMTVGVAIDLTAVGVFTGGMALR